MENFVSGPKNLGAHQSLRLLYPRMIVPLKDEVIREICCGHAHTLAVNQYGQMYVWGQNEMGQLGLGSENIPDAVRRPILNPFIKDVSNLAAGHTHSLALTKNQELYSWGWGYLTGHGLSEDDDNVLIPRNLQCFQGKKIQQVACGGLHTAVIVDDGDLFIWGSAEGGQLGLKLNETVKAVNVPTKNEILARKNQKIKQVSCGETHTMVLTTENKVWGWGLSMCG